MHIDLVITLLSEDGITLLSMGYGTGHVVVQIDGENVIKDALTFVDKYKKDTGSNWMELGHFATCPVSLTLSSDVISIIIDTDVAVRSFGQSAGIYIPKDQLDEFIGALEKTLER